MTHIGSIGSCHDSSLPDLDVSASYDEAPGLSRGNSATTSRVIGWPLGLQTNRKPKRLKSSLLEDSGVSCNATAARCSAMLAKDPKKMARNHLCTITIVPCFRHHTSQIHPIVKLLGFRCSQMDSKAFAAMSPSSLQPFKAPTQP